MNFILYLLFINFLVGIDQFSKLYIIKNIELNQSINIINNFFDITYVRNYGAGFSILQNEKLFLILTSIICLSIVIYLLIKCRHKDNLSKISYLLIIGGALGNLVDRIRLGYVVDFLDFLIFTYDFPVFNLADTFLTIGCFLLIIQIFFEGKNAKNRINC